MVKPSFYVKVTDDNFREISLKKGLPTVAVFGSEALGGMSMLDAIMENLAPKYPCIYFFKLDEDLSTFTKQYGTKNAVSICFLNNGEVLATQTGLSSKTSLKEKIALLE